MKRLFGLICVAGFLFGEEGDPVIQSQPIAPLDMPLSVYQKNPTLAAGLSVLLPGLGHTYLGDYQTAGALFGSSAGLFGTAFVTNGEWSATTLQAASAVSSYGIYAAYRDARKMNGEWRYSYKMPTDSFGDLLVAPFKWSVIKKPEVWGGLLGSIAAAAGLAYWESKEVRTKTATAKLDNLSPAVSFPVGIGEESLFRGYLQSQISEWTTPSTGIALSSLLFGAAHIPNGASWDHEERNAYYAYTIPYITLIGAYYGWVTYKNQSLQESVALHTWYDFTLLAVGYAARNAGMAVRPSFAVSIPF